VLLKQQWWVPQKQQARSSGAVLPSASAGMAGTGAQVASLLSGMDGLLVVPMRWTAQQQHAWAAARYTVVVHLIVSCQRVQLPGDIASAGSRVQGR
jgi:hypothetical protein